MEGRVERSYLGHAGQTLAREPVGFEAVAIVQRGEFAQFLDRLLDLSVDDDGLMEAISSMHHTMAYGLDFDITDLLEDGRDRLVHTADALHFAFCEKLLGVEEVELQRRTACVQDQDLHSAGQRHSRTSGMSSP